MREAQKLKELTQKNKQESMEIKKAIGQEYKLKH